MRHSAIPLIMTLVVGGAAALLIRPGRGVGFNGPTISEGIQPLPDASRGNVPSLKRLVCTDLVRGLEVQAPPLDLECERWGSVVVSCADRGPISRSVALGLAEELTARGSVVVIDPLGESLLPLGSDRVILVGCPSASTPTALGAPFQVSVAVTIRPTAFPPGSAPADLSAPAGGSAMSFGIDHSDHWIGPGVPGTWAGWYATVGRDIGATILRTALQGRAPRDDLPVLWDDVPRAQWPTDLPLPPNDEAIRWWGVVDQDLVRGWIGRIPTTGSDRSGDGAQPGPEIPVVDLVSNGGWHLLSDSGITRRVRVWDRIEQGVASRFSLSRVDGGWHVCMWQAAPSAAQVFAGWFAAATAKPLAESEAAAATVSRARQQLRRHLLDQGLPVAMRRTVAAWLTAHDPDVVEITTLARTRTASATERVIAAAVRYVHGDVPTRPELPAEDGRWPSSDGQAPVTAADRPGIFTIHGHLVLLLSHPGSVAELDVRDGDGAAPLRTAVKPLGHGALTCSDGTVVINRLAGRVLLSWAALPHP